MKKTYDLGRGISALFDSINDNNSNTDNAQFLSISNITTNPHQPRKNFDLAEMKGLEASIQEHGILLPIIVRKVNTKFEIVAGERRYRAAKNIGLEYIPVVIKEITDTESFSIALIENLQRENLNAIEEALAFSEILKLHNFTQEQLGKHVGKTRSYIANSLRLLTLPDEVQNLLKEGKISPGHARNLIGRTDSVQLAQTISENKMSVREVEKITNKHTTDQEKDIASVEKSLSSILSLPTTIHLKKNGGEISIAFKDLTELENFISLIYSAQNVKNL